MSQFWCQLKISDSHNYHHDISFWNPPPPQSQSWARPWIVFGVLESWLYWHRFCLVYDIISVFHHFINAFRLIQPRQEVLKEMLTQLYHRLYNVDRRSIVKQTVGQRSVSNGEQCGEAYLTERANARYWSCDGLMWADAGPTLNHHSFNVSCLQGEALPSHILVHTRCLISKWCLISPE